MEEKTKKIYRYRSFDTALAELNSGILRYTAIDENNDPTDGHFELVFNGDKILWKNFFKNYIKGLFIFWNDTIIAGDSEHAKKVKVIVNDEYFINAETNPFYEKVNKIFDKLTKEEYFSNLLEYLVDKDISEFILKSTLFIVHQNILIHFKDVLKEERCSNPFVDFIRGEEKSGVINEYIKNLKKMDLKKIDIMSHVVLKQLFKLLKHSEIQSEELIQGKYKKNIIDINSNFFIFFINSLKESLFPNIYVTCFTKNYGNMCMWAHYAENHNGICFEYSAKEFKEKIILNSNLKNNELKKVNYTSSIKKINFFESMGFYNRSQLEKNWFVHNGEISGKYSSFYGREFQQEYWGKIGELALTKGKNWEYEDEYRIYKNDFFEEKRDYFETEELGTEFLTGVILGKNMSFKNQKKIIELLQTKIDDGNLGEIKVYFTHQKINSYDYDIYEYTTLVPKTK